MENLNKEELKVWIKALRSGKYPQGKGSLQSESGYCCLGVACKVLIPEDKQKLESDGRLCGMIPERQDNAPEWLKRVNADYGIRGGTVCLATLNDYHDYTFKMIADLLEETYLK